MKKLKFLGMAIIVILSLISLMPSTVSADNGITIAQKSAQDYVGTASARLFHQWQGGQLTFVRSVANTQKQEIGYIFVVTVNGKAVGELFVGNSLYNYDVLEADNGVTTAQLDYTLSWFVPGMSIPKQYSIDRANSTRLEAGESIASYSNPLPVPMDAQLYSYDCGPTSGAMIMEYWRYFRGCTNLLTWQADHDRLYTLMGCNPAYGIYMENFGPSIQQYAAEHGYSFSYDFRLPSQTTYILIQTDINGGRPMCVMFVAAIPPDPGHHAEVIKGYDLSHGNYVITNDPQGGVQRSINWTVQKNNSYICRTWKN